MRRPENGLRDDDEEETMVSAAPRLSMRHARAGERRVLVVAGSSERRPGSCCPWRLPALPASPSRSGVDLADAEVIDDDGIALLVNGLRRLHHRRSEVMVVCPPGRIRRALERAGVTSRMTILDAPNGLAGSSLHEPPAAPPGPTGFTGHRHPRSTPARRLSLRSAAGSRGCPYEVVVSPAAAHTEDARIRVMSGLRAVGAARARRTSSAASGRAARSPPPSEGVRGAAALSRPCVPPAGAECWEL
jgi:hypothetical protein